jgi:FkbM family methyltransferase
MLRRIQRLVAAVVRSAAQGWRLSALAPSPAARALVVARVLWLALPLVVRPRRLALPLAVRGRPIRLYVEDAADVAAAEEVLLRGEYEMPALDDVEVIVDLGSHIGTSILFFRARYPDARIYGFEPDPATFAKLEANVGGLAGVTVQRRAVAAADGESVLHAAAYSLRSSLVGGWSESRAVTVPAARLDRLVNELGLDRIDLLKLDIEGAETEALAGAAALGRVRAIAGELHPQLTDPDAFLALLRDFDVRLSKPSDSSWRFQAVRRGG